jgi:hypothetical protein
MAQEFDITGDGTVVKSLHDSQGFTPAAGKLNIMELSKACEADQRNYRFSSSEVLAPEILFEYQLAAKGSLWVLDRIDLSMEYYFPHRPVQERLRACFDAGKLHLHKDVMVNTFMNAYQSKLLFDELQINEELRAQYAKKAFGLQRLFAAPNQHYFDFSSIDWRAYLVERAAPDQTPSAHGG